MYFKFLSSLLSFLYVYFIYIIFSFIIIGIFFSFVTKSLTDVQKYYQYSQFKQAIALQFDRVLNV